MITHSSWRSLLLAVPIPVLVSCANELFPGDREVIDRWLHCSECRSGEREAVRALGPRAVPALTKALKEGPPSEYRENMRRKFNTLYTSIKVTGSGTDTSSMPRTAYVERAVNNYVATYQKRAAASLGDIGGQKARDALRTPTPSPFRADVTEAIHMAQTASGSSRFRGSVTPKAPPFGDTVVVRPPAFAPFNADELALIDGSPVSPNDTRVFGDSTELRFIAVGFSGLHRLTIQNVGTTTNSEYTDIVISNMGDANDRVMSECVDHACRVNRAPRFTSVSTPTNHFFTLWRNASGADTLDLLKFEPQSGPLHVSATVNWWPAGPNVDLRWAYCAASGSPGNTNGATQNRPEQTTVDIPAGQCWLLLIQLMSNTAGPIIAHVRISP